MYKQDKKSDNYEVTFINTNENIAYLSAFCNNCNMFESGETRYNGNVIVAIKQDKYISIFYELYQVQKPDNNKRIRLLVKYNLTNLDR